MLALQRLRMMNPCHLLVAATQAKELAMTKTTTSHARTYLSTARWWVGGLGVAAALMASMTAFNAHAEHGGRDHQRHMMGEVGGGAAFGMVGLPPLAGRHAERFYKRLNVTDEQKAQLQDLAKAQKEDMLKQREAHQALHQDMKAMLRQPNIDDAALQTLRAKVLAHHQEMAAKRWDMGVSMARVLTPEQRQQLADMMDKREARMKDKKAHHRAHSSEPGLATKPQ
jgi:periplasmic protein CpxP/Spy